MGSRRTYDDHSLAAAVEASTSWRGVLRALGLRATSSTAIRSVRNHAELLGIDHSHITGRRWGDAQLAQAVQDSQSWTEVAATLGLAGGSSVNAVKAHALRLGLETGRLTSRQPRANGDAVALQPDPQLLRRAASMLAAGWLTLCGHDVSWPLEPCRYDLLVMLDEVPARIQVKTTTVRRGETWVVWLSNSRTGRILYAPDEIDYFFVIDGDFGCYLIPIAAVAGRHSISLSACSEYRIDAAGLSLGW